MLQEATDRKTASTPLPSSLHLSIKTMRIALTGFALISCEVNGIWNGISHGKLSKANSLFKGKKTEILSTEKVSVNINAVSKGDSRNLGSIYRSKHNL